MASTRCLRNLGVDPSQATDVYAVNELRNLLSAGLVGGGVDVIDLIAIDIQRVRDVGLASLNQTRVALHLEPYKSFAELTPDPILQKQASSRLQPQQHHQPGQECYRQCRFVYRRVGGETCSRSAGRPYLPGHYCQAI